MATTRNENEIKADIERHQRDHSPNILANLTDRKSVV